MVWPKVTSVVLLCHLLTYSDSASSHLLYLIARSRLTLFVLLLLKTCKKLPGKMNLGQGQDWDTVVIRKRAPSGAGAAKDKSAVAAAVRSGAEVESVKKFAAGSNKAATGAPKDAAKLDRETEELHHERCAVCFLRGRSV